MKRKVLLLEIENNAELHPETDGEFFEVLQHSLLLALKEDGFLNEGQLLRAEEKIQTEKGGRLNHCRR